MAVTVSGEENLPYWVRQGGVGGGYGGVPPQGWGGAPSKSWLDWLSSWTGVSPANAAEANPHGDGPPGPVSPQPVPQPSPTGNSVTMDPTSAYPLSSSFSSFPTGPGPTAQPTTQPMGSGGGYGGMSPYAWGTASPPTPPVRPGSSAPAPGASSVSAAPSAANPLASSGGAGGQQSTSNPRFGNDRFIPIQYGAMANARGPNSAPIYTALNLQGLFGGAPQGSPSATPSPASPAGARIRGPLAANPPLPPTMPDDIRRMRADQIAGAGLKQRYG